jgi:hypothetical protein
MILDAGCGNRAMWQEKNNPDIVFIDIEKQLSFKPNIFTSNTSYRSKMSQWTQFFLIHRLNGIATIILSLVFQIYNCETQCTQT